MLFALFCVTTSHVYVYLLKPCDVFTFFKCHKTSQMAPNVTRLSIFGRIYLSYQVIERILYQVVMFRNPQTSRIL